MQSVPGLLIERGGGVLTLTLDNGARGNEMTGVMFDAMLAALREEEAAPNARVLRIRARGDAFCTGRERAGRDAASLHAEAARIIETKRLLRTTPMIAVAEVQGDALGYGFGMAILCDFVLAADTASLGFPEIHAGLAPSAIMSYLGEYALPRHAFPLVLFGDRITPARAVEIGLINEALPAERLAHAVDALIARILALDEGAARGCKTFFQAALQDTFEHNLRLAVDTLAVGSLRAMARTSQSKE